MCKMAPSAKFLSSSELPKTSDSHPQVQVVLARLEPPFKVIGLLDTYMSIWN